MRLQKSEQKSARRYEAQTRIDGPSLLNTLPT